MDNTKRSSLWHKFAKWQREKYENHPMLSEFFVDMLGALTLVVLSLIFVPASVEIKADKIGDDTTMIFVKNKGFLDGDSLFKVFVKEPLAVPPRILSGKQYVQHIAPMGEKTYSVEIKDLHRHQEVEIEFKTGDIVVED